MVRSTSLALCASLFFFLNGTPASAGESPVTTPKAPAVYIDSHFENASPLWYESTPDGTLLVHLLYDHEWASPNRAAGHIRFSLHAPPGTQLTLEFTNLNNVWNGRPASVASELKTLVVSEDGNRWTSVPTVALPGNRVQIPVTLQRPQLQVARVEPYDLSTLDHWLKKLRRSPLAQVTVIGRTVQGRPLEIVRLGNPRAPHRVFLRARAHPWETGGNWVLEGLAARFLERDAEARAFRRRYCVYLLPMANKDGVACGMTRFNVRGQDLNRHWDQPADPALAPENAALERWLEAMIRAGQRPELALELHNDGNGLLHISRPPVNALSGYLERMATLEQLLRKYTWFTAGTTPPSFRNAGTLGDGWFERYGIDAVVHEFNCNWIEGLQAYPSAQHWKEYGAGLARVLHEYFGALKL